MGSFRAIIMVGGAVAAIVALIVVGVTTRPQIDAARFDAAASESPVILAEGASQEPSSTVRASRIEVPAVAGLALDEARHMLELGGFVIITVPSPAGEIAPGVVLAQEPEAGTVVERGARVTLWYASDGMHTAVVVPNDPDRARRSRFTVCIDPGHQEKPNADLEPVGPGATKAVPKVAACATGVVTKQSEAQVALEIALELKRELELRGVAVVLTRTTNAVDISNAERARIANASCADLFVRIYTGSDPNGDVRGISTLYPAGNPWVAGISAQSKDAATRIQKAVLASTGAPDRGLHGRSDLAGFNWCTVPAVLIECGYLSSPVEDRLLATSTYRKRIALGLAEGVLQFLEE